ncbi:MAG TPA: addiction module protein [Pyrinomonadaceae bacterium]
MSSNAEKILQEALNLPPQDRAEVLERLLATFQEPPDPEVDKLWAQEAEDRIDAYDRGEIGSVSAEDVFARIERHRLKRQRRVVQQPRPTA